MTLKFVDSYLNSKPMYRLVLEGLSVLSGIAILFGFLGLVSYGGFSMILSLAVILVACIASNYIFSELVSASRNIESPFITGYILFLIMSPATTAQGFAFLAAASVIAMASKYFLTIHKKHIFNPAAIAVFALGVFGVSQVSWWVGTPWLFIPTLIIGLLVLRKTEKFTLFFSFAILALLTSLAFALKNGAGSADIPSFFTQLFLSWPLLFFGTIMLTEPVTLPPTTKQQATYGTVVGLLFGLQFHIGPIFSTPELALVIGNIYTYMVSPKYFSKLTLVRKEQLSPTIYQFAFSAPKKPSNIPGQYLQWTLPHAKSDSRGVRRFFTIASSPTEDMVQVGVRFSPQKGSSFKNALLAMKPGDTIAASGLTGEFVLPKDPRTKLVFIAGGIGITPFRSMIKYLVDRKEQRMITLLYSNKNVEDIAYKDLFDRAEKEIGLKVFYVIDNPAADLSGLKNSLRAIDTQAISSSISDFAERTFYISGPPGMVSSFKGMLRRMGLKRRQIKTDFFPGF